MENRVSIIVPVYKSKDYLAECLDSILRQDFEDRFECLLLDFGGDNESSNLCIEYEKRRPDIFRYYRDDTNRGIAFTRNFGLFLARGDYISFIDSDDIVSPSFLSTLVSLADKEELDIIASGYYTLKGEKRKKGYSRINKKGEGTKFLSLLLTSPFQKTRTFVWGRLFRKELIGDIRFPVELEHFEDLPFTYQSLLNAKKVRYIKKPLYTYRIHDDSSMTRGKDMMLKEHLHAFYLGKQIVQRENPELARKLYSRRRLSIKLQLLYDKKTAIKNGADKNKAEELYRNGLFNLFEKENKDERRALPRPR